MKDRIPKIENIIIGIVIDDFKDKFKLEVRFSLKIANIANIKNILVKLKAHVPVPKSPGNILLKGRYKVKANKNLFKFVNAKMNMAPTANKPKTTSNILFKVITSKAMRTRAVRINKGIT